MRYALMAKGMPMDRLEAEARRAGARELKRAKLLNQVFCDLTPERAARLARVPGLVLKPVRSYQTDQVIAEPPSVETLSDVFYLLRSYFTPPLTGTGLTVAVLDSGVRKTHQSLKGRVVYEANFTDSPSADDVFGHGTQVAFAAAGGMHAFGEKAGVSPGASIVNLKVISDEGTSSLA